MKLYLIIVLIGVIVFSLFFVLWEKTEDNIKESQKISKTREKESDVSVKKTVKSNKLIVPSETPKEIAVQDNYSELNEIEEKDLSKDDEARIIPYNTALKMEEHIEKTYDSLIPDAYEETIEDAEVTFASLDEHVAKVEDIRLEEEMEMEVEQSEMLSTEDIDQEELLVETGTNTEE